jgi:hypothetical protein
MTVFSLMAGVFAERVVHKSGAEVTLDMGPAEVRFEPAQLLR